MKIKKTTNVYNVNSHLWNFENLKKFENYKIWARRINNVLKIIKIYYTCIDDFFAIFSIIIISLNIDDFIKITQKNSSVIATKIAIYKIWQIHNNIVKNYVFDKLNEYTIKLIKKKITTKNQWNALKKQYLNIEFIIRHSTLINLLTISLTFCNNDINKFIVTQQTLRQNLENMKHSIEKWILIFILLNNFDDRFKKYVIKMITQKENFIFEKIAINLQELKRMSKQD